MPDLYIGPVEFIEVFNSDVKVKRRGLNTPPDKQKGEDVTELSRKSLRRLTFVAQNTDVAFTSMITLTYPRSYPSNGKAVKSHLNTFLTASRRRWPSLSYLWFMEFQKRGAPHFHILLSVSVVSDDYKWVANRWYEIVASGDERHLKAGTRTETLRKEDGAKRYVTKYAAKPQQKSVPVAYSNCGRFWGHSRDVKPVAKRTIALNNDQLEALLNTSNWPYAARATINCWSILFNAAAHLTSEIRRVENGA